MKKVNLLCLLVLGLFFTACHSNDDTWGDWSMASEFPGKPRTCPVCFQIGKSVYVGLGRNESVKENDKTLRDFHKYTNGKWSSKVDSFPTIGRYGAVAFVIGNRAYVGTGYRDGSYSGGEDIYYNDFYIYEVRDDGTEGWVKDADGNYKTLTFPGTPRKFAVAFGGDNGKGYVGTGLADGDQALKDFWSFNPDTEQWEIMEDYGGTSRAGAVVFKVGGKFVLCLGATKGTSGEYSTDVLAFDPATETWEIKEPLVDQDGRGWDNDYGQIKRSFAVAFTSTLDGGVEKGYIATGQGPSPRTCWEYDIRKDRWDEVTELPAAMTTRNMGIGFSVNGHGYTTLGGTSYNNEGSATTWRFTPGIDEDDYNDYSPVPEPGV